MESAGFRTLGRTGLKVGRLGVASSYGAPTEAFEEAFDHGVNYFYWGSKRTPAMATAIRNIIASGKRDQLVIVIQSYARSAALMEFFYHQGLKRLGVDNADILLLGWHKKPPSPRLVERAREMREKGLVRFLGISGHYRPLFAQLADDTAYDLFHIRYNAAHRGAEDDVFAHLPEANRPGIVTYTATRWGDLINPAKMPAGDSPLSAEMCYRFVLANSAVDVCMTGPRDMAQMREALKALDAGPLSPEELVRMRRIGDHVHANHQHFFS